jgi:hypothetical protein
MRSLISAKCEQHSPFRFVTMNGQGRVCCAGDKPEELCDECRAALPSREAARPRMPGNSGLPPVARQHMNADTRTYGVPPQRKERERVPSPPSLHERIKAARAAAGRGLTILAGVGTNRHGVPNPPRLTAGGR